MIVHLQSTQQKEILDILENVKTAERKAAAKQRTGFWASRINSTAATISVTKNSFMTWSSASTIRLAFATSKEVFNSFNFS